MSEPNGPDIAALFDTWTTAYAKGDIPTVMSIFDASLIYKERGIKEQTFESLGKWFGVDFLRAAPRPTWKYEVEWTETRGDFAVVISRWVGYRNSGKPKQTAERRLRCIDFLRLGADGWKIVCTLNDPEPSRRPPLKPPKKHKKKPRKKTGKPKKSKKPRKPK